MKLLVLLTLLTPQLSLAEGLVLTNGKFPEKDFGLSVVLELTKTQEKLLELPENKEKLSTKLNLTEKQKQRVLQQAQLKIEFINVFDGKEGYGDCTCFGIPSNLASRFNPSQIQLPYSFIEDSLMQKASQETLKKRLDWKPDQSGADKKIGRAYQLDGVVANLPVKFELVIPKNRESLVRGHYTYLSGKFKGKKFKLLGKQETKNQFHLREYKITEANLRHTADIRLTKTNKLLTSRDSWKGHMTNIDGTKYHITLVTSNKLDPDTVLHATNN